ncbi:MAG: hypothetical protein IIV88_03615, partial [Erysipelotrichaceae bacterium]|nr:hypothetical protein [Erysipelotrichaceae bacterium]
MIYRVFQDLKLSALGFGAKRQPRWRDPVHVSRSNSPAASRPISNIYFAHLSAFISEVIMRASMLRIVAIRFYILFYHKSRGSYINFSVKVH